MRESLSAQLVFRVATPEDFPAMQELGAYLWGANRLPSLALRQRWYERHPETDYVVEERAPGHPRGRVRGYISCMTLRQAAIEDLLHGRKRVGAEIEPDDLVPLRPGVPLSAFILALAVDLREGSPQRYGSVLFAGCMKTLKTWGERGLVLQHIYATSATPYGIRACHAFGFSRLEMHQDSPRQRFVLHVEGSSSRLVRAYHQALATTLCSKEGAACGGHIAARSC